MVEIFRGHRPRLQLEIFRGLVVLRVAALMAAAAGHGGSADSFQHAFLQFDAVGHAVGDYLGIDRDVVFARRFGQDFLKRFGMLGVLLVDGADEIGDGGQGDAHLHRLNGLVGFGGRAIDDRLRQIEAALASGDIHAGGSGAEVDVDGVAEDLLGIVAGFVGELHRDFGGTSRSYRFPNLP